MKKEYSMTLNERIEMLRMGVRAVTRGYKTSRLITGSPGIGKSYAVIDELKNEGVQYVHITGGIKDAKAFYITLYKHNNIDFVIVLDDVNDLIRRRQNVEILRAVVANEKEREVTYAEKGNQLLIDGIKSYPPKMKFHSKVIIVTNIPKNKIDSAIVSRTSPIEIIVNKYEIAPYIEQNLENAPPRNVPLQWKQEAWNYIIKEVGLKNVKHLDFRVFEDIMLWYCAAQDPDAHTKDWKKFAYSILI